jgi:uncharacterized membrane protein YoaK (UPF0700 family)
MIRYGRSAQALAISLAALAGYVDAVGFLLTGGLFVSFMSGNSTRMAVDLASVSSAAWLGASLIACFVAGVVFGSLFARRLAARHKAPILLVVALLLAVAASCDRIGLARAVPLVLAMAMGCSNTIFQRDGDVTIGVTYMTGALVRFGQRLADALSGGPRWQWLPWLLLWAGLVVGATLGALVFLRHGSQGLWPAAVAALLLALWARRLQPFEGR